MNSATSLPQFDEIEGLAQSFGILSTFPPTSCGIATFSAALSAGLLARGASVDVVRCGHSPDLEDSLVVATLNGGDPLDEAVAALNATDVAIIQHEYGIYGGRDGEELIELMERLHVPTIVVAHTVVTDPTDRQRHILEQVCASAGVVVVMTITARDRLFAAYDIDASKVIVIPHGATTPAVWGSSDVQPPNTPPRLLTWGLLGPGKGIEWAIDALGLLADLEQRPEYVIAGATHPKVLEQMGESYRSMLVDRVVAAGVDAQVVFDDTYRDLASLMHLIRSADVVVLPYDSVDQVTSGVLVDAVAAGRPVISTAFPHAVELLASGAGVVVAQRDPEALADAIRKVLTEPGVEESMAAEARRLAPSLSWEAVASTYVDAASQLVAGSGQFDAQALQS